MTPQRSPPNAAQVKLASERVTVAAPMSFAGSTARVRDVIERINVIECIHGGTAARVFGSASLVLLLLIWWLAILAWYMTWGLLLVPFRVIRRGQRSRDAAMLRHREFMAAMHSQPLQHRP